MSYAHSGPAWVAIDGAFTLGEGADALQYAADWTEKATPEEREAAGVAEIVDGDDTPPEGEVFAGWAAQLEDVDGVPTRVATFAVPARRLIAKSVVQERVDAEGKMGDALTALLSQPLQFARWFAPDWPNVYADDEGLLMLLAAIGCTEGQIATITA